MLISKIYLERIWFDKSSHWALSTTEKSCFPKKSYGQRGKSVYGPNKNTRAARIRRVPIRSEARFKQAATTVIRLDRPDALCSARHPSIPKTEPIAKRTSMNGTESKARNASWSWRRPLIISCPPERIMGPIMSNSTIAAAITNKMRLALVHLPGD